MLVFLSDGNLKLNSFVRSWRGVSLDPALRNVVKLLEGLQLSIRRGSITD
jgi:hypothetical protein